MKKSLTSIATICALSSVLFSANSFAERNHKIQNQFDSLQSAKNKAENRAKQEAAWRANSNPIATEKIAKGLATGFAINSARKYTFAAATFIAAGAAAVRGGAKAAPPLIVKGTYDLHQGKSNFSKFRTACDLAAYARQARAKQQCLPYPGMPQ